MARILLIDDYAIGMPFRAKVLERHGHLVQIALNGAQGLAFAEALPPDIVLLDHTLPDMTGPEVNSRLRQLLPDVKLISISGELDIAADYDPPPHAVLTKGESVHALLQAIDELTQ